MDFQQTQGYMRPPPPPPPAADPYQRPPPPVPSQPPNHPWPHSSPQFQYQPQTTHSPSPPPPQWPPPHSSEQPPYPSPPPPYPPHQPPSYTAHPHYQPPHPLPPRPPQAPQSYPQEWGGGSWSHQQSWQYPTNNSEEDWGEKAKAWLAAKGATENQHPSSQLAPAGRSEENNHFRNQYYQPNGPQFYDVATPLAPASNYQQYPGAVRPPNRSGLGQFQDSQHISSGQSSYAADMHAPFAAKDRSLAGDPPTSSNPLIHRQEVPSSYSSAAGNEEAGDRSEKFNSPSYMPVAPLSQHHVQTLPPGGGRSSGWTEEPHNFGSLQAESASDPSNQPLNFAPYFNRNLDSHPQPNYTHPSRVPVRGGDPSNYAWTHSMAQGAVYPPMPQSIPPGVQVDHSIAMPPDPMFPSGSSFQSSVPMMGAAFGVGVGVTPPTVFSGDAYGFSERPKKASVPNWLREEIIKNKAVITSSAPGIPKEESQSLEEDSIDKSSWKGNQVDSKSIDSFRSSEDEDEDEDEVEAARTLAINQEIKRVLTEVLLKVTDELFDEIATKVIREDDLSVEVGRDVDSSNHQIPTQSVLTPKASEKILISVKTKENDYNDASEKSTSAPTGDVLGLGSYASDEEDDETQSPTKLNLKESSTHEQPSSSKLSEVNLINENGSSSIDAKEQAFPAELEMDGTGGKSQMSANISDDHKADGDLASSDDPFPSKKLPRITEDELQRGPDDPYMVEKSVERNNHIADSGRLINDDSGIQETRNRFDRNERLENKRSSVTRDHKDSDNSHERLDRKGSEEHGRQRLSRTEKTNYHNSKDKGKEISRNDERVRNTDSRKRASPSDGKEGNNETLRDKRASGRENNNEKRRGRSGDEKRERSGHRIESESSRHKRHRSPSRGKGSREYSVVSRANDSSDESSDDSRRKSRHSKRRKSPSPVRTRKRHVSRSPHSRHSKRRHSPYSSLDTSRGKKSVSISRSRSPAHRRQ